MLQSARLTLWVDRKPTWLQSFSIAWPCALLLNLTVLPQVRKWPHGWQVKWRAHKLAHKKTELLELGFYILHFSVVVNLLNIITVIQHV
ncbi:DUF2798 domain-containing protein [Vibrio vulnificus]|uniref:DUF2798 domain-containing protein n=1 Tax=Vibrio vulnificus TaxID=672 RepID=UPI0028A36A26|nr:DUF2798 domain-containing protein [Vibrio vulnificus]EIU7862149.1 DUF2798 domain-containing protein [Vibrio vulnificus]EJO9870868.1 DUF2798 domain-containing protein [Vibrio vulnificus]ELU4007419.1 DUF2798 domain-containing protein [Vibrio vulnificus]ELV8803114.1 DUF2798 domain-containing protein [Vibrio vulnificus]